MSPFEVRRLVTEAVDELLNDRADLGYHEPGVIRGAISARNRILRALSEDDPSVQHEPVTLE